MATTAGVDPLELRLRLDADADRQAMMREGAELIGWSQRQATGSQAGTIRRGFGVGTTSWGRFPAMAEGAVVINRDGSVEVRTGSQDIGTGQRTIMGVLAANEIGVPLDAINVRIGRSTLPLAPGSGGSMTAHNTAPAMVEAARDAKGKLLDVVADHLNVDAGDLTIVDGTIRRGVSELMSWNEACRLAPSGMITGRGDWNMQKMRRDETTGHSHGVQFVDLRVDTATGVIRVDRILAYQACGRVVSRKTAESQIIGGVIQGLSYALFEDKVLDRNLGTMVNPNLEWYKIAGTADMPRIEPLLWTRGQTGVRSLGEPPTIPTAGAIACAVYNAIGRPPRHLPLTPKAIPGDHRRSRRVNPFAIANPRSYHDAATLLSDGSYSLPMLKAGGMDIVDHLKEGLIDPDLLINIRTLRTERTTPLIAVTSDPATCASRASTTLTELDASSLVRNSARALADAAGIAATPQVRNVATVAGNLLQRPRCWYYRHAAFDCLKKGGHQCFAVDGENEFHAIFGDGPCHIVHPSNLAPALAVLGGIVHLTGGNRDQLPIDALFHMPDRGLRTEHTLEPNEVITHVTVDLDEAQRVLRSQAQAVVRLAAGHGSRLAEPRWLGHPIRIGVRRRRCSSTLAAPGSRRGARGRRRRRRSSARPRVR